MQELKNKRSIAKHISGQIKQIYCGQAAFIEVAREYDLTQVDIERWN